jgi:hypothetical protein
MVVRVDYVEGAGIPPDSAPEGKEFTDYVWATVFFD